MFGLKKKDILWLLAFVLTALSSQAAEDTDKKELRFKVNEAESMLVLFNRTTVSGSDVELIAKLSEKLNTGFQEAKKPENTDREVLIPLNTEEVKYCLAVINRSTFEAQYAVLIFGMKQKLQALLSGNTQVSK